MAIQMFTWRVGAIPLDVNMVEKGIYRWRVPGMREDHEARMHEKGNWSLTVGGSIVQIGLSSLRWCVARSFEVDISVVRNVSTS